MKYKILHNDIADQIIKILFYSILSSVLLRNKGNLLVISIIC